MSSGETSQFLQPDYDILVDGISPYWLSLTTSRESDIISVNAVDAFGSGQQIIFTLAASEDLTPQVGMQIELLLRDKDGNEQNRTINGEFCQYDPSSSSVCLTAADIEADSSITVAEEPNYSKIIFPYVVGEDPQDSANNGIDHTIIISESYYSSGSSFITQDTAGNQFASHRFADIDITPSDTDYVLDTSPPTIDYVAISGFEGTNDDLAISTTGISFTLNFIDADLNLSVAAIAGRDLNLTVTGLTTGDNNDTETNSTFEFRSANQQSITFTNAFADNIDWSGQLTLHLFDYNNSITDLTSPTNRKQSSSVESNGTDSLAGTYIIDTANPRLANQYEISSLIDSAVTASAEGYGPGREITFQVTFNEVLSSISGSTGEAALSFFIYDDYDFSLNASRGLKPRVARTPAPAAATAERPRLELDANGEKSIAYFYYTVSTESNSTKIFNNTATDEYDSGTIYLSYEDRLAVVDETDNKVNLCEPGATDTSNTNGCYMALSANLEDTNGNDSTYTTSDSRQFIYAFNRNIPADQGTDPYPVTRIVSDPLEIVAYSIGIGVQDTDQRAFGSTDEGDDNLTTIGQDPTSPYIGGSESEAIFFIITPGFEGFSLDTTPPVDINLSFSLRDPTDDTVIRYNDYIATYLNSNSEELTFTFAVADFGEIYETNITLGGISQNADMTYENSGIEVQAFTDIELSNNLDTWSGVDGDGTALFDSTLADNQLDTGLLLDLKKPTIESVIAYTTSGAPVSDSNSSSLFFGRGQDVIFQLSFSEPIKEGYGDLGSNDIRLPLILSNGSSTTEITATEPFFSFTTNVSNTVEDLNITYTVLDEIAGEIFNDNFHLTAVIYDNHNNFTTTEDLNFSIDSVSTTFSRPRLNGEFPSLEGINIYRAFNPDNATDEVTLPVPDFSVDPAVDDYTFTEGGNNYSVVYVALSFTYSLLEDELPNFAKVTDTSSGNEVMPDTNYSFDLGTNITQELNATPVDFFSTSVNSIGNYLNDPSSGANAIVFSFDLAGTDYDSEGNYITFLDLVGANDTSKENNFRDIYGNPVGLIPDSYSTVVALDSQPPELIGVQVEPLGKVLYGPLDTNITFALTFNEPIHEANAISNGNLNLSFRVTSDAAGTTSIVNHQIDSFEPDFFSVQMPDLSVNNTSATVEDGELLYMIYRIENETNYEQGYIVTGVTGSANQANDFNISVFGTIYDSHNENFGNSQDIEVDVSATGSDQNSSFFVPILEIDKTRVNPSYWAIEYSEGSSIVADGNDGLAYENNGTSATTLDRSARIGIDKTVSFVIGYDAEIDSDSLYATDDLTAANSLSLGATTLGFIGFTSSTSSADFNATYKDTDTTTGHSRLTYTYVVLEDELLLEDITIDQIHLPQDTIIRTTSSNEVVISDAIGTFSQRTDTTFDGSRPRVVSLELESLGTSYTDPTTGIAYFGEGDIMTFRITFSEELFDENTSSEAVLNGDTTNANYNNPDFDLRWYIQDEPTGTVQAISTDVENNTSNYYELTNFGTNPPQSQYALILPINLLERRSDFEGLQGPLFLSSSDSNPTTVFSNVEGDLKDNALNVSASMPYQPASDTNLTLAVDFIRPQLQYITSAGNDADKQYVEYDNVDGEQQAIYYGADRITFYAVHDSTLFINGNDATELNISILDADNVGRISELTMQTSIETIVLDDDPLVVDNAPQFNFNIQNTDINYSGAVTFTTIDVGNYGDRVDNKAYMDISGEGLSRRDYDPVTSILDLNNYVPTVDTNLQQYGEPTIYIDTVAPVFSIADVDVDNININNLALQFTLTLDVKLSDLEASSIFNSSDVNATYHSAPAYDLSLATGTVSGLLYDDGSGAITTDDNQIFTFRLFSELGEYTQYLDDLQDNTDHTITLRLTDFVDNYYESTFDVYKVTDEFQALITGYNPNPDPSSPPYYNTDTEDGSTALANNATQALFVVSFITDIKDLNVTDLALSYSLATDSDIADLVIADVAELDTSPDYPYDWLITVEGGNLPLASGQFALSFSDDQAIETAGGFALNLDKIDDINKSFTYTKAFEFNISSVAQTNHGDSAASPAVEVNFTIPDFDGVGSDITIDSYKLYYALSGTAPSADSAYFSTVDDLTLFSRSDDDSKYSFNYGCLFIPDGESESYSFRLAAAYTVQESNNSYQSFITASAPSNIELNLTVPKVDFSRLLPELTSCSSSKYEFVGADTNITSMFGRGLAFSRDAIGDLYISGNIDGGGAIRHYSRLGSQFELTTALDDPALQLLNADLNADVIQYGHNIATPISAFSTVDLFAAADPSYVLADQNLGSIYLFNKDAAADTWNASTDYAPDVPAAAGSAIVMPVNATGDEAFVIFGEPLYDDGSGRVQIYRYNTTTSGWVSTADFELADVGNLLATNDANFGSAIAITADSSVVAISSARAVYLFSFNSGSLIERHAIYAEDYLGADANFTTDATNQAQALAIQATAIDAAYLLAIGLPHDSQSSNGITYVGDSEFLDDGTNYGSVLLLGTTDSINADTSWHRVAHLRTDDTSPAAQSLYGSKLQFANPEQPTLLVSQPGFGIDSTGSQESAISGSGKLHVYYLNTAGYDADSQEFLLLKDSTSALSGSRGYAYAFDYSNNVLATANPISSSGAVSLRNVFTAFDYDANGANPQVSSSRALSDSTVATSLSFAVRFPATVDPNTINDADFEVSFTTTGAASDLESDHFTFDAVEGGLGYWEVTVSVDPDASDNGKRGDVYLLFSDTAEINSSAGAPFDLSEFNSSAVADGRATPYTLDYATPGLYSITRSNPYYINADTAATFEVVFTEDLNTSNLQTNDFENTLDDYFFLVANNASKNYQATFTVAELSSTSRSNDDGVEISTSDYNSTGNQTTFTLAFRGLENTILAYTDPDDSSTPFASGDYFTIELDINTTIVDIIGNSSGNALDVNSLDSPSSDPEINETEYFVDFNAPVITAISHTGFTADEILMADSNITYQITFNEALADNLDGEDFTLPIAQSASSTYGASIDVANLDTILASANGGNGATKGSGYTIDSTNNPTFTLTLSFVFADFTNLVTDPFALRVLDTNIEDLAGNSLAADVDDDANLSINFRELELDDQELSLPGTISGAMDQNTYKHSLNMFNLLDAVETNTNAGSAQSIGLGFKFTFSIPIDTGSVANDLSDFNIRLGTTPVTAANSTLTFEYPDYDPATDSIDTVTHTYDLLSQGNTTYLEGNTVLFLNFPLSAEMLEYGFDLPEDLNVSLSSTNGIQSSTGRALVLSTDSNSMAYSVDALMPLLQSLSYVDPDTLLSDVGDPPATGAYATFTYSESGSTSETYYGARLRYQFSEDIESVLSSSGATAYSSPANSYYLEGAGSNFLLSYSWQNLGSSSNLPGTGSAYDLFVDDGSLLQSTNATTGDPASTTWDHLAYLSDDIDDFANDLSAHTFTIIYDDDYIEGDTGTYPYPALLGGYASAYTIGAHLFGNLFLDADGNPARVDPDWLSGAAADSNRSLTLTFEDFRVAEQSFSIPDNLSGTLEDGDYTASLNMFSILDAAQDNISSTDAIGLGFTFTFSNPIDSTTVDTNNFSDFNITIDGTPYAEGGSEVLTFTYSEYNPTNSQIEEATFTYDIFANATIDFNPGSTITELYLNFEFSAEMLEYGFDLPNITVAINSTSAIESTNGQSLGAASYPMTYSVNARMPVLAGFSRIDDNNQTNPNDIATNEYQAFTYDTTGTSLNLTETDYYGFRLRYQFSENIAEVRGRISTDSLREPDNAYYLSGAGSSGLLGYTYSPTDGSNSLPDTDGDYSDFITTGSLLQSTNATDGNASSTDWDHLVYLSQDEDHFANELSVHTYSIVYDSAYIDDNSNTDYPHILGGYGTNNNDYNGINSATLFLDEHGNPARVDPTWLPSEAADANATLEITFEDFGIASQSLSIADPQDGSYQADLNIFSFLDKIRDNIADNDDTPIGLGFDFTFSTPIDPTSVNPADDLSQFTITIDGTPYSKGGTEAFDFAYSSYNTTSSSVEQLTDTYDIFDNAKITFSANDTVLHLNFELEFDMLESGFDLPSDNGGLFQVTLLGDSGIVSANGKTLEDASQPMAYTVNSSMPLLSRFDRVVDEDGNLDPSDATIDTYATVSYNGSGIGNGTFSGIQLRYQFSEAVASVLGPDGNEAFSSPTNAFYLSGAGEQSLLDHTLDPIGNPSPKLPDDETDQYSLFLTEGSFVQSTSSTNNDPSSTTWDHFAYLTVNTDNFIGEISQHIYSIIADSDYINDPSNQYAFIYPNLLGGYGSGDYAGTSNATLFLDEHGNPARVDPEWLSGGDADANATISLTFEDFTLLGASHSIQDNLNEAGDTSTVNIFGFLDQINADVDAVPSLDFDFTFNTTIDDSTVTIVDDFIIELGAGGGTSTTFTHASYDSSGAPTTIDETYDFSTPDLSTNGAIITISFPITDTMLEYGFDLTDNLRVYLDPNGAIQSASGIAYSEGSDILAYAVKSRMPLVTDLAYVPSDDANNPITADLVTTDYSTIDYNDGSDGSYFGFVLQYTFDEDIESVQGRTDTQNYASSGQDAYYYLEGAGFNSGSAPLLSYIATKPTGSSNLPDTNGEDYAQFLQNGALVNFPTNNPTRAYHYAYLTDTEDHFAAELSVHSYQLVGDDNYINGAAKTLPAVLGGYGSGGTYSGDNSAQNATLLFDADGNPVRVDANFTVDDSELVITYEDLALSSQNFIIDDTLTQTASADDTTVVNMFGFLDQLADDPTTLPSFGVQYSFSSSIDPNSVSKDDFDFQYDNADGNTDFTFTFSNGTEETYNFYANAQVDVTDSTITIAFPITARMLSYGIDLPDLFQISISASNDINTTYGTRLELDTAELAATTMYHDFKSEMPYLVAFHLCNNGTCSDADTLTANHYTTTYGASSSTDDFYGFQFSYRFHEQIHSLSSPDGADPYTSPTNSYYLDGAGTSSLLEYTELSSPTIFDSSTDDYAQFVTNGSLVGPANINTPLPNTALYHYTYLTNNLDDLGLGTSEHSYQIVYDADYISGVDSSISLPILFGGYGNSGYAASSNQSATLFLDADGNPARFPDDWISSGASEDLASITITHDAVPAELTGASALDIADLDSDGIADDYNGAYGTYGNSATFAFALTFDGAMNTDTLQNAILWEITSSDSSTAGAAVPFDATNHASDDGTNFIYTFYYAVEDIYAASGTYAIEFVGDLKDTVGNSLGQGTLNDFLATDADLCASGTCQFANEPPILLAATFDPAGANGASGNTTAYENLEVTLTFSAPVSFVASDLTSAFDLTYTTVDGTSLGSTSNLAGTLQSLDANTSSESDGAGAYTQHVLSIQDTSNNYWAQNPYTYGASILALYFQDRNTKNSITYTESFATASGTLVTLPTSIQDGTAASGTSTIRFSIVTDPPQFVAAAAVAASGDNVQGDAANERHVQFQFSDFSPGFGDGIGMHLLFRTTDDAFDISADAAPYYGAEGGLVLTGSDLSGDNSSSIGHHICPPFSKHLDRIGSGANVELSPIYNANRYKIHYLIIPYDPATGEHFYTADELNADPDNTYDTITIDFNASNLSSTEPCVRSAFYNDGAGQYGYVVDSDMEEQHMVIANAMLQNQSGDTDNLGMLPTSELEHVYFDLYSKDYYNDSWRQDLTITAQDLLADLSVDRLNSSIHRDDADISYSIDPDYLSIFASRFVNTINARFLDSVFLDSLENQDIPAYNQDYLDKHDEILAEDQYQNFAADASEGAFDVATENDFFHPDLRNQDPDVLASANDNRLVLSIGVHPSAIQVDAGTGLFHPFETESDNFLKMDSEFYGLYYGGVADSTEPAFDYTSRHLAYINFDLVYNLDIDDVTGAITGYSLHRIISPFTLLKYSFFRASELASRQANGETYSAVAISIADNVFRHNFAGTDTTDSLMHFLPYGLYCYQRNGVNESSTCYNDQAQMLLPNPASIVGGYYSRTVASLHNLHRGVLFISNAQEYELTQQSYDSIGNPASTAYPDLLERFMRLNNGAGTDLSSSNPLPSVGGSGITSTSTIDARAYSSMLYNSFDRAYGYDYSYGTSSTASFDRGENAPDSDYISDDYEQQYWGLSPYAESPDARADQILPNAFMLGGQVGTPYHYKFLVQPYQYSGFTQQINYRLSDPDYLINKNTVTRGLLYELDNNDLQYSGEDSLNLYGSFAFPNSSDISSSSRAPFNPSAVDIYSMVTNNQATSMNSIWFENFPYIHISGISSPHAHGAITRYATKYANTDIHHSIGVQLILPQYHSGRTMGYYATDSISVPIYALHESFASGYAADKNSYYSGFAFRSDFGARPTYKDDGFYEDTLNSNDDGEYFVGTLTSSTLYDDSGKQRLTLPHHADDYDFDRGQIMAHKLGFFLDDGNIMEIDAASSTGSPNRGYTYSRLFFPSDPATITLETSTTAPIVTAFDNKGLGEVANYYPLVLANESLHTASNSWPVLLTRHQYGGETVVYDPTGTTTSTNGLRYTGLLFQWSEGDSITRFHETVNSSPSLPIALDKIFPESYRYQLGFVNREELFMYDPEWVANGSSGDPVINRFYASAVGHFGYATQYSRLNRRSMQKYHLGTSSQFLGDHLARFEAEPTAGVHISNDIEAVFAHTPANQGGTGTNYGSYGAGYYNIETTSASETGTWRGVAYDGTLRGYVLELRTNPIQTLLFDDYESGARDNTPTNYPTESNGGLTTNATTHGAGHPSP